MLTSVLKSVHIRGRPQHEYAQLMKTSITLLPSQSICFVRSFGRFNELTIYCWMYWQRLTCLKYYPSPVKASEEHFKWKERQAKYLCPSKTVRLFRINLRWNVRSVRAIGKRWEEMWMDYGFVGSTSLSNFLYATINIHFHVNSVCGRVQKNWKMTMCKRRIFLFGNKKNPVCFPRYKIIFAITLISFCCTRHMHT